MKHHTIIIAFVLLFCCFTIQATAQVEVDTNKQVGTNSVSTYSTNYFQDAIDAYQANDFRKALADLKKHEQAEGWSSSSSYWKILTSDKLLHYDDINDPVFIGLSEELNKFIKYTNTQDSANRDMYANNYEEVIKIEAKANFAILRLKWDNDADYQKALTNFKINNYGVAKLDAEKAAKSQNGNALLMIGQIYESGWTGNKANYQKAMHYYKLAYLAGSNYAAYHIGYLYFHGIGVYKNINLAFQWCKIAAEYKYVPAMKELANMYKHGLGVRKDLEKSYEWEILSNKN